jgi:hypothetical protein
VLDETIREAGRAVAAREEEMVRDIEEAVLFHADETPWKVAGKPLCRWVDGPHDAVFHRLASVVETCRKRAASSWRYIATVIAAAGNGVALPCLPPIPLGA